MIPPRLRTRLSSTMAPAHRFNDASNVPAMPSSRTTMAGRLIFTAPPRLATPLSTNNFGGHARFHGNNTGDNATIVNNSFGVVEISGLTATGIGIGSLSGSGAVYLGSKTLTLGRLGRSDRIGGVIQDGGSAERQWGLPRQDRRGNADPGGC